MKRDGQDEHLSRISTHWSVVRAASGVAPQDAREARRQILNLYGDAVHRYLLGAVRNREVADELFQEFASRFLEGRMSGADPARGRFRDYVKGVLFHMISDQRRALAKQARVVSGELVDSASDDEQTPSADEEFQAAWREEVLSQCWTRLELVEQETGKPYHRVLRYRTDHPGVPSTRIARQLEAETGHSLNGPAVRQMLHRAREKFSDFLLDVVAQSLENATRSELEAELIELGLFEYCRPALDRWRES